jgi:hypothetical protein
MPASWRFIGTERLRRRRQHRLNNLDRHVREKQYIPPALGMAKVASMSSDSLSPWVKLRGSPIAGLRFRYFRGKPDFPAMVAVTTDMREADQQDYVISEEDLANEFEHTDSFNPKKDVLIAEADGAMIGWARV